MDYHQRAYEHIQYLSETIGGRGSCTENACRAAKYAREKLQEAGVAEVKFESFNGAPSTYLPFTCAFACAFVGTIIALLVATRAALAIGALLNLLGVWAMFAESEFSFNWTHWLLPRVKTQNVTGVIHPCGAPKLQVVLCAHLDTHRTPIFYSSKGWLKVFNLCVSGAFLSMALATLVFGLGSLSWTWLRWAGLLFGVIQLFVLTLVITAEFTSFSPGANDNASGVGVLLALVDRMRDEPLMHTTVNLVLTDCEETGAYGSRAYLNRHAAALGRDSVYIILDEVGAGHMKILTEDGLILKRKTHPRALELARAATEGLTRPLIESAGMVYTDALPATKLGLIALVVSNIFHGPGQGVSHWHQMSDRIEFIDKQSLKDACTFTWNILQVVDQRPLN